MSHVRLLALDALYIGVGTGVLVPVGLVRSRSAFLRLGGLALMTGWAIVGIVATCLLVLGFAATVPQVLAATSVVVAAAWFALRRLPPAPAQPPLARVRESRLAVASAFLLYAYLAVLLWRSLVSGLTWWDAWAFWVPKALTIVHFGGLDAREGGITSFANPEYPPFIPALHALGLRFVGDVDPTRLPLQDWVLAAAFLWALAGLLAPHVSPRVLWPSLLMLATIPNFGRLVGALTGDEPLAFAFALAGVSALLWRLERSAAHCAVAVVFFAAVPLVKREGLVLSLALIALLALVAAPRLSRAQARVASLALVPLLAIVPWRLWLRANGIEGSQDYVLGNLVRPGFLLDRAHRLVDVLRELPWYFLDPNLWLVALPVTFAAAALAWRTAPEAARLVVLAVVVGFVAIVAAFWISRIDLATHIVTTAARVPIATMFLCVALVPLLLEAALRPPTRPP